MDMTQALLKPSSIDDDTHSSAPSRAYNTAALMKHKHTSTIYMCVYECVESECGDKCVCVCVHFCRGDVGTAHCIGLSCNNGKEVKINCSAVTTIYSIPECRTMA